MQQWETKREQKKQARDRHVQELHRAHPDLAKIDEDIANHALKCIRESMHGKPNGLDQADAIYQALQAQRQALLEKYHLSEADYEPQWDCALCKDRGYIRPGVLCECQKQKRREATYLASGLPEKYRHKTFANFRTDVYNDPQDVESKLRRIHAFIDALAEGRPMGNLVLRGEVGRGKTHLSAAIANACLERGLTVVYRRVDDLMDLIRVHKFEHGQEDEATIRMFDLLVNCDLLILDDFGAEVRSDFVVSELTRLIEERNLKNKSWIINTNLEYNSIGKQYDTRLWDRIDEKATVFRLEATKSLRIEEARKYLDVDLI